MKFLCDRCKTRYSIGDDRVRGKILKIRCKNCANVITVREGMSDADAAVGSDGVVPPGPTPPGTNGRALRPTTMSPVPAHTANVNGAKPPAALDEEWYVSIDGEQSGPFSLTEAQRWIGAKPFTAELHCWSEGFDDWLPVDKVSHFRGVRKKPEAPAQAPPPIPRGGVRTPVDDEPKPLFAATMASLERGNAEPSKGNRLGLPPTMPTAPVDEPRAPALGKDARPIVKATPAGGVPVPRTNGAAAKAPAIPAAAKAPAIPAAAKGTGSGAAAAPLVAKAESGPTNGKPAAKDAKDAKDAKPKSGKIAKPGKGAKDDTPVPRGNKRAQTQPGHEPAPAVAVPGFDVSNEPDPNDTATAVGGSAFPDDAAPPAARFPVAAPAPMFPPAGAAPTPASLAPKPTLLGAPAPAFAAPAPAPAPMFPSEPASSFDDSDDDGLDIGEVSRVVNLADLMKPQAPKDRVAPAMARRTGANPMIRTGSNPMVRTGSTPRIDPGALMQPALAGAAAADPLAYAAAESPLLTQDALADAALPMLPPPTVEPRRNLVALLLLAVLVLGGVGAVVAFALSHNDDQVQLGLAPNDQIDTTRPEDLIRHNPFVPQPGSGSSATIPHTNPNLHHPIGPVGPVGPTGPGSGKVEGDPLGPTSPLKPDEIEDMSSKQSSGATRCWDRALRKQPYLQKDIKKVSVTITVDALGGVTNVQLAGMPTDDGNLGSCLQSYIRAWRFRQSSAGITAKFSMVFQNG